MLHEQHFSTQRFWDTVPGSLIGISQNSTWINYKHIYQNHPNLVVGDKTVMPTRAWLKLVLKELVVSMFA